MTDFVVCQMRKKILSMDQCRTTLSDDGLRIRNRLLCDFKNALRNEMSDISVHNQIPEIVLNEFALPELNKKTQIDQYVKKRLQQFPTVPVQNVANIHNITCKFSPTNVLYQSKAFCFRLLIDIIPKVYDQRHNSALYQICKDIWSIQI